MSKLDELNALLDSVTPKPVPKPKAKPKAEALKDKLAASLEPERAQEVLAQSQAQFHEEERRQLEPLWKRNRRIYGSSRPPSEDEVRLHSRQTRLDRAIEATRERKRAEAEHERALNEYNNWPY